MKVRRRGFMASLAALVAGGVAAREAKACPPQLADDEYMRVNTGGDTIIRGGSGTGSLGFYGAEPVALADTQAKLTDVVDELKKIGLMA